MSGTESLAKAAAVTSFFDTHLGGTTIERANVFQSKVQGKNFAYGKRFPKPAVAVVAPSDSLTASFRRQGASVRRCRPLRTSSMLPVAPALTPEAAAGLTEMWQTYFTAAASTSPELLAKLEWIGAPVTVALSAAPGAAGLAGVVIHEGAGTVTVAVGGKARVLPKKGTVLVFRTPVGEFGVALGALVGRPVLRTSKPAKVQARPSFR